jgi:hypothetical protein
LTERDDLTAAASSAPALWRELGRIREDQGLSYAQLRNKVAAAGTKISKGTLSDRLRNGRQTSWGCMRPVVVALGQDEDEWKKRYDCTRRKNRESGSDQPEAPADSAEQASAEPWWTRRCARIAFGLVAVGVLCPVALFVWPAWLSDSAQAQDTGCARVSDGTVRVYDEPGSRKRSFVKYEGERIQFPIPIQESTGSDGLRYRRVLTPSRYNGDGWIASATRNLGDPC